jgi:hypothetical protein
MGDSRCRAAAQQAQGPELLKPLSASVFFPIFSNVFKMSREWNEAVTRGAKHKQGNWLLAGYKIFH